MKVEFIIDETEILDGVRKAATAAGREALKDRYGEISPIGRQVRNQARAHIASYLASGEVQRIIRETAESELTGIVKDLTRKAIGIAVKAEIKRLRENGELQLNVTE